jgi:hypothetical protein
MHRSSRTDGIVHPGSGARRDPGVPPSGLKTVRPASEARRDPAFREATPERSGVGLRGSSTLRGSRRPPFAPDGLTGVRPASKARRERSSREHSKTGSWSLYPAPAFCFHPRNEAEQGCGEAPGFSPSPAIPATQSYNIEHHPRRSIHSFSVSIPL